MGIRTFQSTEDVLNDPNIGDLPTDQPVVVYYRQSTSPQVGNIATAMQTIDMVEEMKRRGWANDLILLIDMDAGISGTLKIDERAGMRQLFDLITSGSIGAVACQDEDRLFRDVTQIQVNIFIDACLRKKVQVITPSLTYVFHHPTMGDFYKKQFRFKCEVAAEYLNYLKLRLGGARDRLRREGKYAGGRIPLGYMVDYRKDSLTYRKYVPWPEMAEIVRRVFVAFVECDGHSYTAATLLRKHGIRYPINIKAHLPPGFMFEGDGGKSGYLTPQALRLIVTNPAYLGHWMYKGAVLIWNNHQAIVDPALFFKAFNYVSPNSLDGSPNPHYQPTTEQCQLKERPERNGVAPPLLTGLLYAFYTGKWYKLGKRWSHHRHFYEYVFRSPIRGYELTVRRKASYIDEAVDYHVFERLQATFDEETFAQSQRQVQESAQRDIQSLNERLISLEQQRSNTIVSLSHLQNPTLILELEQRFAHIESELSRTQSLLQEAIARANTHLPLPTRADYERILTIWPHMQRDAKRRLFLQFVKRVEIPNWGESTIRLMIHWVDNEITECELWRRHAINHWSYAEQVTLSRLVRSGVTKEEVIAALPSRSWGSIRKIVRRFMPDYPVPRTATPTQRWATRWAELDAERTNSGIVGSVSESRRDWRHAPAKSPNPDD